MICCDMIRRHKRKLCFLVSVCQIILFRCSVVVQDEIRVQPMRLLCLALAVALSTCISDTL